MNDQIVVNGSPVPAGIATIFRYALTAIGGLLVSKGYFAADQVNDIVGFALVILPAVYGLYKTLTHKKEAVQMANMLPDSVAVVK